MLSVLSAAFTLLVLTPEAPALLPLTAEETPDPRYLECVGRVRKNVDNGRRSAERWASEGGGAPAQHCLAVAELAAGFARLAAARLEALAARSDAGDELIRARILSQAALAWLEAELPAEADRAINAAFAAAPGAGELYLPLAKVHLANKRLQATIDAVTTAESRGFTSAEGFVLRGRARHSLTQYRDAADDVVAALSIDPFSLDALVLRGDLAQAGVEIEAYYSDAEGAERR